jgi:hypothetical protein
MRRAQLGAAVILAGTIAACTDSAPPAGIVHRDPVVAASPTTTETTTLPEVTTTTEPPPPTTDAPTTTVYDWGPVLCPRLRHPAHHEPCPVTTTTEARQAPVAVRTPVAAPADDVWWALALCEDGGRNRDFGPYSGYFHFLPSTYHANGGTGQPSDDDYETQKAVAMRLQAREGWAPWPGCRAKLGLP